MNIFTLLEIGIAHKASDIHLSPGQPPVLRIDGEMVFLTNFGIWTDLNIQEIFYAIMTEIQIQHWLTHQVIDFSLPGYRIHLFQQVQGMAAAIRILPTFIPMLDELGLSNILQPTQGLVLITGATGSGKSTTLAAMIHHINLTQARHIVTLEDPIEFIHTSQKSLVNQRQLQSNFSSALRSALREDPDVIMIGELRDLDSLRMALMAATTGHLVLATLHASSVIHTLRRIIDMFPSEEKNMIKHNLADSLGIIMSQTLMKKLEGGRTAAFEIMVATAAIKNLIREEKFSQIYSAMQMGTTLGMRTFEQAFEKLEGVCRLPEKCYS